MIDRQSQALVLENIRSQLANRWQQIVAELATYGDHDLPTFLDESGLELSDILRRGSHSWTELRRDAGLPTCRGPRLEEQLLKRVRAFAHVDDPVRARRTPILAEDAPTYDELSPSSSAWRGCFSSRCGPTAAVMPPFEAGLTGSSRSGRSVSEISTVVDLSFDASRHVTVHLERATLSRSRCRCMGATSAKRSWPPRLPAGAPTASGKASVLRSTTSTPSSSP